MLRSGQDIRELVDMVGPRGGSEDRNLSLDLQSGWIGRQRPIVKSTLKMTAV